MTCLAGRSYPLVIRASPVSHPPSVRHSSRSRGPAARWMAPSTPPPPSSDELAALTMASTSSFVMSPVWMRILSSALLISHSEHAEARLLDFGVERRGQAERQHLARLRRIDDAVIPQ